MCVLGRVVWFGRRGVSLFDVSVLLRVGSGVRWLACDADIHYFRARWWCTLSFVLGGVGCLRSDVARAFAPVSPRGSAPNVELFRRLRVALLLTSDRLTTCANGDIVGNGSDDMVTKE